MSQTIAIIGGGAAGLTAAISVREHSPHSRVYIFERLDKAGKKLLATGNGRCNLSNVNAGKAGYHGGAPGFWSAALSEFDVPRTLDFFASLGLETLTEPDGKIYPLSGQAAAVLDALRFRAAALGAEFLTGTEITRLEKSSGVFRLFSAQDNWRADAVILAAGGCASPQLGSNGSGYALAERLGHKVTPLRPAIVQIKTKTADIKPLKGIKINGAASVIISGKPVRTERGEILFTEYGISGPPVLRLSRDVSGSVSDNIFISMDLLPDFSRGQLLDMLKRRRADLGYLTGENFLSGLLHKRLGQTLLKLAGVALSTRVCDITDADLSRICGLIKKWRLEAAGVMPFKNAQVTAGGLDTRDFDPLTLESRLARGLYAAGEVLDVDGECGGYNLQWAWSSGWVAGKNAAGRECR